VQKAGHASTSGEVDDEQLFYMQARGIPKSDAVHMIVMGFFESVLDRIPLDTLREQVTADIAARI
jgi:Fe-S cluster assembly protein SufD